MTWARFDDGMGDHRKVRRTLRAAGLSAFGLHALAILHSARYLTDGFVEREFVDETFDVSRTKARERAAILRELERQGMWEPVGDDGWRIHDYLDHNPSRAEVEEKRRRDNERKAKGRRPVSERSPRGSRGESGRPVPTRPDLSTSASDDEGARVVDLQLVTAITEVIQEVGGQHIADFQVANVIERFPDIDHLAEARGCAEYLRANPDKPAGHTLHRYFDKAKPKAVGRSRDQRAADGVAAIKRVVEAS